MHDFDLSNTLLFYFPDFLKNFSVFLAKKNPQIVIWLSRAYYILAGNLGLPPESLGY